MRETKLYSTLVELDGFELNRLQRFIQSPYFNQNESIIRLFEWIKDDLKSARESPAEKEDLWQVSFGKDEPFNDGRFRKLQSDLLKLVEEFFAQEVYESNPIHKANYLIEAINNRNLEGLQTSTMKSAKRIAESQAIKPASYYYYQYELERNIYALVGYEVQRTERSNIESISKNLDHFYIAEKLRNYCTVLSRLHLKAHDYELPFIDQIIKHVSENNFDEVPPILIYYQIFLTYKDAQNREHYDKLKAYIRSHIHLFPESEAKEIIDSALNYCINRMNAGNEEFVREAFELYQESLENKLLFVNKIITPWSFKNIVTIGLRLKEFNWVENFIYTYSENLNERYRNNAVTFNLAQLYFYQKEYAKVISQLSQVEYDELTYNLNSKTLLMASYYELDEMEALSSLLETFRVYLNRNKELPAARRVHYINTLNIVRKLAKIKSSDNASVDKLEKEIESTQGIVSKNWILDKLAALKA
jgi:hypothetical protein